MLQIGETCRDVVTSIGVVDMDVSSVAGLACLHYSACITVFLRASSLLPPLPFLVAEYSRSLTSMIPP